MLGGSERGRDDVLDLGEVARLSAVDDHMSMRSSACVRRFGITPLYWELVSFRCRRR